MKNRSTPVSGAQAEDAALHPFRHAWRAYRDAGWPGPLPLPPLAKKHPPKGVTGRGGTDPDDAQLARWGADEDPRSNIGLRLPPNVIGIDLDQYLKKGVQRRGADFIAKLARKLGALPPTWSSTRRDPGGPSRILFFRVPPGTEFRGDLGDGSAVEIIWHGYRYAVVWPSVVHEHDDTRTGDLLQYAWFDPTGQLADRIPSPDELAELPPAWVEFLSAPERADELVGQKRECPEPEGTPAGLALLDRACETIADAVEGDRNNTANREMYHMARLVAGGELAENYAKARLTDAASQCGLDPDETESVLGSAFTAAEDKPRQLGVPREAAKTPESGLDASRGEPLASPEPESNAADADRIPESNRVDRIEDYEEASGNLRGDGSRLHGLCVKTVKDQDGQFDKTFVEPWADFDIRAAGVAVEDSGERTLLVDLTTSEGTRFDLQFDPAMAVQDGRLRSWLAKLGGTILPPQYDMYKGREKGTRLLRYLQAQDAPRFRVVHHLGWNPDVGAFVTNEGLIRAGCADQVRFEGVRPSDQAIGSCRSNFGFAVPPAEAVEVLRQVLTFHEPRVAAVMGAWFVMRALDGHYYSSVKPTLQVEGKSGSAKTRFVQLLAQLILGSTHGGGRWTRSEAEDAYAANSSGIVWFDDVDIDTDTQEMLRIAATGGEKSKKDPRDFTKSRITKFRAATVLTSEGATERYNVQQANRERAVRVDLPSVHGRMSLVDPAREQWADVKALWVGRFNKDFTQIAGALLSALLEHAHAIGGMDGATRTEQAHDILRAGARVLASLLGDERYIKLVDEWIADQADPGQASTVTLEVIPTLWADHLCPTKGKAENTGLVLPVFRDGPDGPFWVNTQRLADAWAQRRGSRDSRDESLTDQAGVERELRGVTVGKPKQVRTSAVNDKGNAVNRNYRQIDDRYTKLIADKATGNRD